jgi:hypothetical protein
MKPPTQEEVMQDVLDADIEKRPLCKDDLLPHGKKDLPIDEQFTKCTQALFFEFKHCTTIQLPAPYTLKPYDWINNGNLHKSMYLIYMECDSEYEAAMRLLGSWPHWCRLRKLEWFREELDKWNAELQLREQAIAKSKLLALTEAGNVTAARTLLTGTKEAKPGRPSKGGKREDDVVDTTIEEMIQSTTSK